MTVVTPTATGSLDPDQVVIGTANDAGVWIAPASTTAPATMGAFTTPWRSLGYTSDDGVTNSGDTSTETITPWQGRSPLRTIVTEKTLTVQFVMWQLNELTLGLYYDTTVPAPTAGLISFAVRSDSAPQLHAIGVDVMDGQSQFRIVYPRCSLESTGDMAITKSAAVPLDVTLSALDDQGVLAWVYYKTVTGTSGMEQGIPYTTEDAAAAMAAQQQAA